MKMMKTPQIPKGNILGPWKSLTRFFSVKKFNWKFSSFTETGNWVQLPGSYNLFLSDWDLCAAGNTFLWHIYNSYRWTLLQQEESYCWLPLNTKSSKSCGRLLSLVDTIISEGKSDLGNQEFLVKNSNVALLLFSGIKPVIFPEIPTV